ncbi:hypothetical protein DRQ07_02530 [candidate division KSB1 bacterium]|nr:MAG: hypothetical protein DRQ07_02530 [candidate division KSB1 bacterium]
MEQNQETVRIDRWLSAARFFKTRSQAAQACEGGKIKINGKRAKPHKTVRTGDRLTIFKNRKYREIEVLGLAQRGLPAKEAQKLYIEHTKQPKDPHMQELMSLFHETEKKFRRKFKGRPTKKERREIDKIKNEFGI